MDRDAEIALARSAAPASISADADVLVLGRHGFETVVTGKNTFVCFVERSWDKGFDDAEFWNPKMRAPVCMNAVAVSTVLPMYLERAKWALSGLSSAEMNARSKTSHDANVTPGSGAMSFMLSKEQYLSDAGGHWHPHVMFFAPHAHATDWGANLKASPVLASTDAGPMTLFFIPVRKWSDGTLADYGPPPTQTIIAIEPLKAVSRLHERSPCRNSTNAIILAGRQKLKSTGQHATCIMVTQ